MVRQDILAGLRNAVERGYSLEQARNTLINSGYNLNEVNEAVAYLTGGLGGSVQQYNSQAQQIQPQANQNSAQQTQIPNSEKPKKKFPWVVVLLSTFLIALVIVLILVLVLKDQVT